MQKLTFQLNDPLYTFLHCAGVAGLWMTLKQLQDESVETQHGMQWQLGARELELSWEGQDREALDWLFKQAFELDRGVIAFRGIEAKTMRRDAQIIIHQGVLGTFLQHNSTHKTLKVVPEMLQFGGEEEVQIPVQYKALKSYAYQDFAKTLCDKKGNFIQKPIRVAGWLNPGAVVRHVAFSSSTSFEELPKNALALLFAPVACYYYTLQSRLRTKRAQYVLVIPDVRNLEEYAAYRQHPQLRYSAYQDFYACGLGDAGLRFLTAANATQLSTSTPSDSKCKVVTLGTVAWSSQQKTRTDAYVVEATAKTCREYEICNDYLPDYPVRKQGDDSEGFTANSFAREIITENLARGKPWWEGFAKKVNSNETFERLIYERQGLSNMVQDIFQEEDPRKLFVQACHEAIYQTYGRIKSQANKRNEIPNFDRETIRLRTSLSRCKKAEDFRNLMATFWAKSGKLPTLQKHWHELMQFVMDEDKWKEARDLVLISLASYSSRVKTENIDLEEDEDYMDDAIELTEEDSEDLSEIF